MPAVIKCDLLPYLPFAMDPRQNDKDGAASPASKLAEALAAGLVALNVVVDDRERQRLLRFISLLQKWNRVYNLTAITAPQDMLVRHLLDSLAMTPYIRGPRVLDVGTGAGLPGIPLAIALPDVRFTLLDSVAKKTRFVTQAIGELGLDNVRVETERVERYHPAELFDTVISRAFSSLADFVAAAGPHCRPNGLLLAMKGRYPADEFAALPADYRVEETVRLNVPGLNEERHVILVRTERRP